MSCICIASYRGDRNRRFHKTPGSHSVPHPGNFFVVEETGERRQEEKNQGSYVDEISGGHEFNYWQVAECSWDPMAWVVVEVPDLHYCKVWSKQENTLNHMKRVEFESSSCQSLLVNFRSLRLRYPRPSELRPDSEIVSMACG